MMELLGLKLSVLNNLLDINKTARIIGNYSSCNIYLYSEKMVGNVIGCLGFIKTGRYYICNTALKVDIRKVTTNNKKIVCILSKQINENKYKEISYISKKFKIENIVNNIIIGKMLDFSKYKVNE